MANGDEETKLKDALLQINTEIYGNGSPLIDANVTYLVKECQKLNLSSKDLLDNRKTIVEEIGKTGKELNYRLKRFGDVFKTVSDEKAEEEFKENLKDILLEALEDKGKSNLYKDELGRAVRELELRNINLQIIDLGNIIIRDSLILSFEQNINKNFYEVKEALKEKLKTISEAITTPAQNSKPEADATPYVGSVSQEQGISPEVKQANSSHEKPSITNPFLEGYKDPIEKKFREDIAEIIKSVDPKLDANTIVNLINLEGIDLSKIDLKNEDHKETLTEGIKSTAATYVPSVDEESVAKTLSTDLKRIVDQVKRIETITQQSKPEDVEDFEKFVHSRAKQPEQPNVNTNPFYSEVPVSSGPSRKHPSRGELSRDLKQGKGIRKTHTKAQESVEILKNSEIPEIRDVANELSNILKEGSSHAKILENIINKSEREDLQKGCLRLYEDIQPFITTNGSKQTELETEIRKKLPERIKEAKYERKLSFEKIKDIIKKLRDGAKGGRLAILKEEFSKLAVAGKSLAVAATAAATAAAIAATPIVLGVGLAGTAVVAPLAGAAYGVQKGVEARSEYARKGRQKLANTKKAPLESNPLMGNDNKDLSKLAKKLIDFAVSDFTVEMFRMLEVAIEQDPGLRSEISKKDLNILKEYITGKTGKQVKEGEFYRALKGLNLNEDKVKKLLELMEKIENPKSEKLSPEEIGYFHALRKVVTKGLSYHFQTVLGYNRVIDTDSPANKALLRNIDDKEKLADVRVMLKNYSKLDEKNKALFNKALQEKFKEESVPNQDQLIRILNKGDLSTKDKDKKSEETLSLLRELPFSQENRQVVGEFGTLVNAFNSLDPKDIANSYKVYLIFEK